MSDTADAQHRRKLIRAILICVAAMLFLAYAMSPASEWGLDFVGGPADTIITWTIWAMLAASIVSDIVRWFNRRDEPPASPPPDVPCP